MADLDLFIRTACELVGGRPDDLLSWRISGVNLVLTLRGELVTKEVALLDVIKAMGDGHDASPPPDRAVQR